MKKTITTVIALVLMLSITGCVFAKEIPTLEDVKDYTSEDFEIYMRGVSQKRVVEAWGGA